jgi:hypothetical protein
MHFESPSQCIDKNKIEFGGDYNFVNYMFLVPSYSFAIKGNTSRNWNVLNDPIDIKQAPKRALIYKESVEDSIKKYAGKDFFSNLEFENVEIVYPEKYQTFIDSGRQDVTQKVCKAKYFYFYQFKPDTLASYLIGIAVNKVGKIISPFNFPSKKYYKPIDKTFTYCKLINIARQAQKDIDPIKEISLQYDKVKKNFYWLISREIVNEKEGINYINQVEINAANLSDVKRVQSEVMVVY